MLEVVKLFEDSIHGRRARHRQHPRHVLQRLLPGHVDASHPREVPAVHSVAGQRRGPTSLAARAIARRAAQPRGQAHQRLDRWRRESGGHRPGGQERTEDHAQRALLGQLGAAGPAEVANVDLWLLQERRPALGADRRSGCRRDGRRSAGHGGASAGAIRRCSTATTFALDHTEAEFLRSRIADSTRGIALRVACCQPPWRPTPTGSGTTRFATSSLRIWRHSSTKLGESIGPPRGRRSSTT